MLIGYARVSTTDQNLEVQVQTLQQIGCDKIYAEKRSGMNHNRPELNKMLDSLREGDTVVVTKLNRLGRSLLHTLKIIEDFKKQNINLKSLDLGIDTATPAGKLLMNIFASLAQYERENILEQAKAGIEKAKRDGKQIGRPKGYDREKLEKISLLTDKGLTLKEISNLVGCHSNTVKRYKKLRKDLLIIADKGKILQQNIFGKVDLI
ncbi:MAG: recombinase family protein [Solitalea-like symbiont of Acarus siro]